LDIKVKIGHHGVFRLDRRVGDGGVEARLVDMVVVYGARFGMGFALYGSVLLWGRMTFMGEMELQLGYTDRIGTQFFARQFLANAVVDVIDQIFEDGPF
jgi:hypothetical protein